MTYMIKPVVDTGSRVNFMTSNKIYMTRGMLASKAAVNIETIRYYETISLMPVPKRSEGGHRIYSYVDLKRLSFIRRCRELGFKLGEIKGLLELVDSDDYTCLEIRDITIEHLCDVKQKIRDLRKIERSLKNMISECDRSIQPNCAIIETLFS